MATYRHYRLDFKGRFDNVQRFVNLTGGFKGVPARNPTGFRRWDEWLHIM